MGILVMESAIERSLVLERQLSAIGLNSVLKSTLQTWSKFNSRPPDVYGNLRRQTINIKHKALNLILQ